ncbi:MAG: hypothetical protein GXY47_00770 [Acidobacteria bacterium]|nr:hypothetical protein [Acidobacteriota bacterium]
MDADGNPTCPADVYRLALERTPEVWRTLRRPAAILIAGDVAAHSASESGFTPHWSTRQHTSVHEAGHAIIAFLVGGRRSAVAVFENGGGICGPLDSPEAAREAWAKGESDEERNRDTAAAAPDRLDRLAKAIDRLFRRRWYRAALLELANRLHAEDFVNEDEVGSYLEGWFPRSPARIRAMAAAAELAPAPGVEAGAGGGAGGNGGVLRGAGGGAPGSGAGRKGARTAEAGRNEQIGSDLAGAVDQDPVWQNLTINQKGNHNV